MKEVAVHLSQNKQKSSIIRERLNMSERPWEPGNEVVLYCLHLNGLHVLFILQITVIEIVTIEMDMHIKLYLEMRLSSACRLTVSPFCYCSMFQHPSETLNQSRLTL